MKIHENSIKKGVESEPEPAERLRYSNIREYPPSRGNPTITKLNSVRDNFYLTETARVFPAIKKKSDD